MRYQLVILGPGAAAHLAELRDAVHKQMFALGLEPALYADVSAPADLAGVDFANGSPVCVWCAGHADDPSPSGHEDALDKFMDEAQPVLPVWAGKGSFGRFFPAALEKINACSWRPGHEEEDIPTLAANVLRAFRLTRVQRQCFISYRRKETRAVALQLFQELASRGYRPFLDTASVPGGVDFQASLWGQMADVDILIFLDSPHALDSKWVQQELARAHDLGLGVLQVIWPDANRTPGTEFSDPHELKKYELEPEPTAAAGSDGPRLTDDALTRVVGAIENTRIRSLRSRRLQVIGELLDRARARGLKATVDPVGLVRLYDALDECVGEVLPLVGLPDAMILHEQERGRTKAALSRGLNQGGWERFHVTYLGLGIPVEWTEHFAWLNERGTVQATPVDLLKPWLEAL